MRLDRAKKIQTDIMTQVLGYELIPPASRAEAAGFPRFRPKKAWLNADPLGPKTKLKDVDPRRVIGVAIALPPKGMPNGYGIVLLCQRKSDMAGPYITRALAYAPAETRVVFSGPMRMAAKKKGKSDKPKKAKTAPKAKKKKQKPKPIVPKTVHIGDSVSRTDGTAPGTIGCFVDVAGKAGVYILSNNHVLADRNNGQPGDAIRSPSTDDGGKVKDNIADLDSFHPIDFGSSANLADCALAKLHPDVIADRLNVANLPGGTKQISGQVAPIPLVIERVRKRGAETDGTVGEVWAASLTGGMWSEDGAYTEWFCGSNQLLIDGTPGHFAWHGDSGAVAFNDAMDAVGLVFCVSDEGGRRGGPTTVANPMIVVVDLLQAAL